MSESFPPPRSTVPFLAKEKLLQQFAFLGDILTAGTLLIDVRRDDYEGGAIKGSMNIPAQGFYLSMPALHRLCVGDGVDVISRVVFYCGSCGTRGPRSAAWFHDYVQDMATKAGTPPTIEVFALEGGIKGWVAGGEQYLKCMDGFRPEHWKQFEKKSDAKVEGAAEAGT